MLKKLIAVYVALALAISACVAVGVNLIGDVLENNRIQSAMKAENQSAAISKALHDQAGVYLQPQEPTTEDEITFRVRVERYNVTKAQLQYTTDKGMTWTTVDMAFDSHDDTGYYDFWKVTIPPQSSFIKYRFLLANNSGESVVFYTNRSGLTFDEPSVTSCWDLQVGFDVPDWAKGTVWYSITPDVFANGDTLSDDLTAGQRDMRQWNIGRANDRTLQSKYGGDLFGLEQKVAYLKNLGVESIFINATSKANQNIGYGKLAYTDVEDSYGTINDFKNLLTEIHNNGMKLMQDVDLAYTASGGMLSGGTRLYPVDLDYYKDMFLSPGVTGWGGYCLDLGTELSKATVYTTEDSFLQWLARDIGVDALRFDTGGWLWGTTETDDLSANDVIRSMKYYLKKINPDLFFLSEASGGDAMIDGAFESQWNRGLEGYIDGYAQGTVTASNLGNALKWNVDWVPRNIGYTYYTFITQHDTQRTYVEDRYSYFAALLVQFTYVGSPCIYYGEEVYLRVMNNGAGQYGWVPPMEWNPADWDYDMLNYYKALTELRKEFTCLKNGVQNRIEITDNILCFARWDDDGTVITVSSLNEEVEEYQLNAREAGFKDGAVITDWLTGKTYEVKDGVAIVSLIPGGSIFVSGDKSSSYRLEYETLKVGSVNSKSAVYALDDDALELVGKGTLGKTDDDILYNAVDVFGTFNMSAKASVIDGSAALMVRSSAADNAAYYAIVIENGKAVIKARNVDGGNTVELGSAALSAGSSVRIVRSGENTFSAYVSGADGSWAAISGSEKKISMNEGVKAGFAPLSGTVKVTEIAREAGDEILGFDKFDDEEFSGVLNIVNADKVSKADGYLVLEPADTIDTVYSNSKGSDWTFMAALKYAPTQEGNMAGVYIRGNVSEYLAAGRTVLDGKSVMYFGKATNNKFEIIYTAEDTNPNDDVYVQLQKIGAAYTVVYSYDQVNWKALGESYIVVNYSEEKIGPYVVGTQSAAFDFVTFGNCINDGKSYNTPSTPHSINEDFSPYTYAKSQSNTLVTNLSGYWLPAVGGVEQTDANVLGAFGVYDHNYYAMRMQGDFKFTSGEGWVGMGFGKSSCESAVNQGFLLKYTTEGLLQLFKGDEKISEVALAEPQNGEMKLTVETGYNGEIYVFAGDRSEMVMNLQNTGYVNGYCAYYTEGVTAVIGNYKVGEMVQNWTVPAGDVMYSGGILNVSTNSVANLTGLAMTNFVLSFQMTTTRADQGNNETAITLSAPQGTTGEYGGLRFSIDQHGKVVLSEYGYELKTAQIDGVPENSFKMLNYIMVIKQNGDYKFYINNSKTPVIEYSEDYIRGGAITFSGTSTAMAKYDTIKFTNLTSKSDFTQTDVYKSWMNGVRPADASKNVYKQDFTGISDTTSFAHIDGNWTVEDGALHVNSNGTWGQCIALNPLTYDNFEMTFDLKFVGGAGWAGVSFRSANIGGRHATGSLNVLSMFVFNSGSVTAIESAGQNNCDDLEHFNDGRLANFNASSFNTVKLVAKDQLVTVYDGEGNKVMTFSAMGLVEGYIRLTAGNCEVYFDNVTIKPI